MLALVAARLLAYWNNFGSAEVGCKRKGRAISGCGSIDPGGGGCFCFFADVRCQHQMSEMVKT